MEETNIKLEWTQMMIKNLITLYEANPCLWNPLDENYKDRPRRDKSLRAIASFFNTSVDEIRRKIHNLRNQFSQECNKFIKSRKPGTNVSDFKTKWIHFDSLKFIRNYLDSNSSEHNANKIKTDNISSIIEMENDDGGSDSNYKYELVEKSSQNNSELSLDKNDVSEQYEIRTVSPSSFRKVQYDIQVQNPTKKRVIEKINPINEQSIISYDTSDYESVKVHSSDDDELNTFGQFVANELRAIKDSKCRKRLKRTILQAILDVTANDID